MALIPPSITKTWGTTTPRPDLTASTSFSSLRLSCYLAKQAPSQPAYLRLKFVFAGLLGPQVPAPQAGIETPSPDVAIFDNNALGSMRRPRQVPGQEKQQKGLGTETLSFGPKEHHTLNHPQVTDGEMEIDKKHQDRALRKQPSPAQICTRAFNPLRFEFKQAEALTWRLLNPCSADGV